MLLQKSGPMAISIAMTAVIPIAPIELEVGSSEGLIPVSGKSSHPNSTFMKPRLVHDDSNAGAQTALGFLGRKKC